MKNSTMAFWIFSLILALNCLCIFSWPISWQHSRHVTTSDQSRDKRVMGIFRCNGWGPGCSHFNDPVQSVGPKESRIKSSPRYETNNGARYGGSSRHRSRHVFEPFFTLTSGGSWGPTGKKRSSALSSYNRLNALLQLK